MSSNGSLKFRLLADLLVYLPLSIIGYNCLKDNTAFHVLLIKYGFQDNQWLKLMEAGWKSGAATLKQCGGILLVLTVLAERMLGRNSCLGIGQRLLSQM